MVVSAVLENDLRADLLPKLLGSAVQSNCCQRQHYEDSQGEGLSAEHVKDFFARH